MEDGGEGLVDQEAQQGGEQALEQGEGGVEDNQALQKAVDAGADRLIHGDDLVDCHELGVDRVRDVVITGDGEKGHHHRTGQRAEEGAFPGLLIVINHASGEGKSGAQDKIAQFPSVNGGGAFDNYLEQIFQKKLRSFCTTNLYTIELLSHQNKCMYLEVKYSLNLQLLIKSHQELYNILLRFQKFQVQHF